MTDPAAWVLDTNILVSRPLLPRGTAARAVDRALERGILLVSESTMEELVEVLSRPRFDPYVTREARREFIALLGGISRLVPITRQVHACRDPRDDKFLDVALAGGASAILSGDRDLLALDPFHCIPILTPAAFLARG